MSGTHVQADAGEAWWWGDGLAVIKLTAQDTDGQLSIVEITEPAGYQAPLHVHHREDETFHVLDGSATFEVGGTTVHAGPGDVLFGPRGVPHRYEVGPDGVRMLFVLTPGGFEDVVRAMSVPAEERRLPGRTCEPPDPEAAYALVTARALELVDA